MHVYIIYFFFITLFGLDILSPQHFSVIQWPSDRVNQEHASSCQLLPSNCSICNVLYLRLRVFKTFLATPTCINYTGLLWSIIAHTKYFSNSQFSHIEWDQVSIVRIYSSYISCIIVPSSILDHNNRKKIGPPSSTFRASWLERW